VTARDLPNHPSYALDDWMIAWDSGRAGKVGRVKVGPWPDGTGWSDAYESTSGCCNSGWHSLTREEKLQQLVNGFFVLVLGDRLDPAAVHAELWKISAYRELRLGVLGEGSHVIFQGAGECSPYNP
jgi:hypothetical protein